jgi:pyruvate,water dikinase
LRELDRLLATARRYAALREEIVSSFTLGWPVLRRAALRLGEALAESHSIETPDQVFFLIHHELTVALHASSLEQLKEVATQRRQEWERDRTLTPPLRIGQVPATFGRGLDQLQADLAPAPSSSTTKRILRGQPVSPGRATGPARIIRGPAEFQRLQPGDVLVAPTTAPAWTPLFARAAAVVTDTGSVLAHTSLVAREFGIPAVVATTNATTALQDGHPITVDGTTGTIELLD